jgi:hypothetical protein
MVNKALPEIRIFATNLTNIEISNWHKDFDAAQKGAAFPA